jgi:hypothetical protein
MLNKRITKPLIVTLTTVASFLIAYKLKSQSISAQTAINPFVAHGVVTEYPPTGTKRAVESRKRTYGRKSDGSWVVINEIRTPSGEVGDVWGFGDGVTGMVVGIFSHLKSVTTEFFPVPAVLSMNTYSCPPDINSPTAEHKVMLGYDVVKITEEDSGPGEMKEVDVSWVAPRLGCYPLRRSEVWSDGAHNETEVRDVVEGDPPHWMFEVPAGYVEQSPKQRASAYEEKYGQPYYPPSEASRKVLERQEKCYNESHKRPAEK